VSVAEPSNAFNAGMAKQIQGHRLAQKCKSLPSVSSFVVWLLCPGTENIQNKVFTGLGASSPANGNEAGCRNVQSSCVLPFGFLDPSRCDQYVPKHQ